MRPRSIYLWKDRVMKQMILATVMFLFAVSSSLAQATCESKAIGKNGNPLAGAAKTSFMKKCKRDTCQTKAVDQNGKPLRGAAKNSFMAKCQREA
jgi:hypothetical protein